MIFKNGEKSPDIVRCVEYSNIDLSSDTGVIPNNRALRNNDDAYVRSERTERTEYEQKNTEVNLMYHKNRMSEPWLYTAVLVHITQFGLLLTLGYTALPTAALVVLIFFVVLISILILYSRKLVKKNRRREGTTLFRKKIEGRDQRTPDEETDMIPQGAIYCLALASVLEGCTFALYTVLLAGNDHVVSAANRQIILETLRFASITLLAFHRILRPANRVDPMRTVLEVKEMFLE